MERFITGKWQNPFAQRAGTCQVLKNGLILQGISGMKKKLSEQSCKRKTVFQPCLAMAAVVAKIFAITQMIVLQWDSQYLHAIALMGMGGGALQTMAMMKHTVIMLDLLEGWGMVLVHHIKVFLGMFVA
jgi:hypothetical protein